MASLWVEHDVHKSKQMRIAEQFRIPKRIQEVSCNSDTRLMLARQTCFNVVAFNATFWVQLTTGTIIKAQ